MSRLAFANTTLEAETGDASFILGSNAAPSAHCARASSRDT